MKEKHAKRIRDLIKAKWAAIFLLVAGILFLPASPIPMALGILYGLEARRLLRLYPDMDPKQADDLRSAKNMYFIMVFVNLGVWVFLALMIGAIVLIAESTR